MTASKRDTYPYSIRKSLIYKGGDKDPQDAKSYRSICLLNIRENNRKDDTCMPKLGGATKISNSDNVAIRRKNS
jgi:hypothetical protein